MGDGVQDTHRNRPDFYFSNNEIFINERFFFR